MEVIRDAVLNVARYDVFKLSEAWLAGDMLRFKRMLDGLKGEGEAPPLILWAMADDVRTLAKLKRGEKVFNKGPRLPAYERRARGLGPRRIGEALKHAAAIDRLIKGLRPREISDDVWEEFYRLGARLAA
jgi:DNA polymerase-3 subunit delta